MQAVLARIDAVNHAVNAYVTVAGESALATARMATRALSRKGAVLPPLHGVPVAIKDLTATKGIRTTWGSLIYQHHVPTEDDLVVQRLKAAGAIVVGKTNTPEFGAGGTTFNAVFGATRNPWNTALTAGGRAEAPRWPWPPEWVRSPRGRIWADPSGRRRLSAASSGSAPHQGSYLSIPAFWFGTPSESLDRCRVPWLTLLSCSPRSPAPTNAP